MIGGELHGPALSCTGFLASRAMEIIRPILLITGDSAPAAELEAISALGIVVTVV